MSTPLTWNRTHGETETFTFPMASAAPPLLLMGASTAASLIRVSGPC